MTPAVRLGVQRVEGVDVEGIEGGEEFEVEFVLALEVAEGDEAHFVLTAFDEVGVFYVGALAGVGDDKGGFVEAEVVTMDQAGGVAEIGGGVAGVGIDKDGFGGD